MWAWCRMLGRRDLGHGIDFLGEKGICNMSVAVSGVRDSEPQLTGRGARGKACFSILKMDTEQGGRWQKHFHALCYGGEWDGQVHTLCILVGRGSQK